jgi:hypothetical protein
MAGRDCIALRFQRYAPEEGLTENSSGLHGSLTKLQKLENLLQRDYDPGKGVAIPNGRNG